MPPQRCGQGAKSCPAVLATSQQCQSHLALARALQPRCSQAEGQVGLGRALRSNPACQAARASLGSVAGVQQQKAEGLGHGSLGPAPLTCRDSLRLWAGGRAGHSLPGCGTRAPTTPLFPGCQWLYGARGWGLRHSGVCQTEPGAGHGATSAALPAPGGSSMNPVEAQQQPWPHCPMPQAPSSAPHGDAGPQQRLAARPEARGEHEQGRVQEPGGSRDIAQAPGWQTQPRTPRARGQGPGEPEQPPSAQTRPSRSPCLGLGAHSKGALPGRPEPMGLPGRGFGINPEPLGQALCSRQVGHTLSLCATGPQAGAMTRQCKPLPKAQQRGPAQRSSCHGLPCSLAGAAQAGQRTRVPGLGILCLPLCPTALLLHHILGPSQVDPCPTQIFTPCCLCWLLPFPTPAPAGEGHRPASGPGPPARVEVTARMTCPACARRPRGPCLRLCPTSASPTYSHPDNGQASTNPAAHQLLHFLGQSLPLSLQGPLQPPPPPSTAAPDTSPGTGASPIAPCPQAAPQQPAQAEQSWHHGVTMTPHSCLQPAAALVSGVQGEGAGAEALLARGGGESTAHN